MGETNTSQAARAGGWPHKRNQHFSVRVRGCTTVSLTFLLLVLRRFFFLFLFSHLYFWV
jgi:hypothetical protein